MPIGAIGTIFTFSLILNAFLVAIFLRFHFQSNQNLKSASNLLNSIVHPPEFPTPGVTESIHERGFNHTFHRMTRQEKDPVVRVDGDDSIFIITNGRRRHVPNFDTFINLGYEINDVKTISKDELDSIPLVSWFFDFNHPNGSDYRKFFFDLGANTGESVEYFLSGKFQGGEAPVQGGVQNGVIQGMGSDGNWELIVFEANPTWNEVLTLQKEKHIKNGDVKSYELYNGTAVGTYTGTVDFFWDFVPGGAAGSTTNPDSKSARGKRFPIPAKSILEVFKEHDITREDFVVVKMDIEGGEFELLKFMAVHGITTRVDILAVEFHDTNRMVLGGQQKYIFQHQCLNWVMQDLPKTHVISWD